MARLKTSTHLILIPVELLENCRCEHKRRLQDLWHHGGGSRLLQIDGVRQVVRAHVRLCKSMQPWLRLLGQGLSNIKELALTCGKCLAMAQTAR